MRVKLTFIQPLLGTAPMDQDIYGTYIASKRVEQGDGTFPSDEMLSISDDKGKTGFHRDEEGNPFLYDYMIKGFFKDTCGMLSRVANSESKKLKAYKKIIDGLIFIEQRQIPITMKGEVTELQRPLRAQTAQGERVALACSEMIQGGSTIEFDLTILDDGVVTPALIKEWFDYGKYRGLGQWRNGSYGRFAFEMK